MHFCCRKAKNSCFAPKPWFTVFLSRMSRKTQHTRFEDKILKKLADEDKPQVVTPWSWPWSSWSWSWSAWLSASAYASASWPGVEAEYRRTAWRRGNQTSNDYDPEPTFARWLTLSWLSWRWWSWSWSWQGRSNWSRLPGWYQFKDDFWKVVVKSENHTFTRLNYILIFLLILFLILSRIASSSSVNAYIDILVCGLVFTVVCLACLARFTSSSSWW